MRNWIYVLMIGLLFFIQGGAYAESPKIGFIDAQKILEESKEGKRIKAVMEEFVKSRQKIIDLDEEELKKLEDDFTKQSPVLSADARKAKEEEFQKKMASYQKRSATLNKEVQEKKMEGLKEFNDKLEAVVKQIAEKEGYQFIFDRNEQGGTVVYANASYDITPKIIEQIDKPAVKQN